MIHTMEKKMRNLQEDVVVRPESTFAKFAIWHPGVSWQDAMSGLVCEENYMKRF